MSIDERLGVKRRLHPRILANEVYLAHPNIVRVGNPNVNPARETERMRGDKPLSSNVLPDRKPLRRF